MTNASRDVLQGVVAGFAVIAVFFLTLPWIFKFLNWYFHFVQGV